MKLLFLAAVFCAAIPAQTLTFYIHDTTNATPDQALSSTYQFANTAEGGSTSVTLKATNSSSSAVFISAIYVGDAANSSGANPNFTVTGAGQSITLAPQASMYFKVNFTPASMGALVGYLQAAYQTQQNGCSFTSQNPATQCPSATDSVATLQGTATAPQLLLSYATSSGNVPMQPNAGLAVNFGNVSTSATSSITFTLANVSLSAATVPSVSLQTQIYASSAFSLDTSKLPATLAAGASATFTVTFAPGQTGLVTATLLVGTLTYPIQGTGIVLATIDALQISYVDQTGVRTLPQAATPISFGQLVAGTNVTTVLTFTVTNPSTSYDAVDVPAVTVSGTGFSLSGAPAGPTSIAPGSYISFKVTFTPGPSGNYTGTLAIGSRQFSLTGQSVASPLPSMYFQVSANPLVSQQQVNVTLQLGSASTIPAIGQLTMQFTPSVSGVSDDPAVLFLATSGRQLQVSVAAGAQTAIFNNQSAIAFQTGTTAGTITFTVSFPNTAPYIQSFQISPAQLQITSATAMRQAPNLVVTLNGFDNTYSAGKLSFTFYDTSGHAITPNGIAVDATSNFHQYFFTNNQAGGAFALQASFPVAGDATQVGSVAVTLTNSAGTASTTQNFQ